MNAAATFPTSKYKIILTLSIFVFILTFFVYSGLIDYDSFKNKAKVREKDEFMQHKLNRSLLEKVVSLIETNLTTNSNKNSSLFCMILTTPKNFKEKVIKFKIYLHLMLNLCKKFRPTWFFVHGLKTVINSFLSQKWITI